MHRSNLAVFALGALHLLMTIIGVVEFGTQERASAAADGLDSILMIRTSEAGGRPPRPPARPRNPEVRARERRTQERRSAVRDSEQRRVRRSESGRGAERTAEEGSATGRERKDAAARRTVDPIGAQQRLAKPGEIFHSADVLGRPEVVEGWLQIARGEPARGARTDGTDRGHLMPRQLGGPGEAWNLCPENPRINRSYVQALENSLAARVRRGEWLYLRVRVRYGDGERPSRLTYDVFRGRESPRWEVTVEFDPLRPASCTLRKAVGKGSEWYGLGIPGDAVMQ